MNEGEPIVLEDAVSEVIAGWLEGDRGSLDRVCSRRPDLAPEIRARVASLASLDLLPDGVESGGRDVELGDFRLLAPLGRGGMGTVHLARQLSLGRIVALKVLRRDLASTTEGRERFRREAAMIASLSHPSIVPVHSVGEADGSPFLAMEFVSGCSLAEALATLRGRDPSTLRGADLAAATGCEGRAGYTGSWTEACFHVARQIASALEHAHARGVLHRDVKPSNVMLDGEGRALLVDFGLALSFESEPLTASQTIVGSLPWLPPERMRDDDAADSRGDVYGLGATLFQMLALRPPFDARDLARLTASILAGDRPRLGSLNRRLERDAERVCEHALETEPDRRYSSMEAFRADIEAVLAKAPISVREDGWLRTFERRVRREPWRAVAAATLVLLVVALGWFSWRFARQGRTIDRIHSELRRVDDRARAASLVARARNLWPAEPSRLAGSDGIDAWLADAESLVANIDVESAATEEGDLEFVRVVQDVRRRAEYARTLRARTVDSFAREWSESIRIARESDRYRGLVFAPQVGLVPLGVDARSGLLEFAVLATGDAPSRDDPTGRLILAPESACVLVLIPGGEFRMGAEHASTDPEVPVDPNAEPDESPATIVALDAFLLGKHELTQAQWLRLAGTNPSVVRAGTIANGQEIGWMNPVDSITRLEAIEMLGRAGLALPTEAQWECAARAGTKTRWWTGDSVESLAGAANLADRTLATTGRVRLPHQPELDDGFVNHAPCDALTPNPYGLHHVIGNVREICLDPYAPYSTKPRAGDGLREVSDATAFIVRDGAFVNLAASATASQRSFTSPDDRAPGTGVRPARRLERE